MVDAGWYFDSKYCDGRTIRLEWNLWTHFCGIGFDIDDDGLTLHAAFPPIAFWLTFGMRFWPLTKWPRRPLSENYPNTMVIDERECSVKIHDGRLRINPWSKTNEWAKADPWWVRGISVSVNPFEWHHMRHEVLRPDGTWVPFVGSWERDKEPDGRKEVVLPFHYTLKSGAIQDRTATICVERRSWRPRCLRWTPLFEKARTTIDVQFSDEVGERTGSWKGGTIGCGYELRPGETPEQCLRRMESELVFA